ncbi:MAG: hypothetical protein M0Z92_11695 [Actinomycetota bacterium]|nr:hypothetical protein [Actinomycetota bacterium]
MRAPVRQAWPSRNRTPLLGASLAAAAASILALLVPFGNDTAAHLFLTRAFALHGFSWWDNYWYFGRFDFIGYSYLYYPFAAVAGVKLPAVAGITASGYAISRLLPDRGHGAGIAAAASALVGVLILTGAYPFLLGMGLAALALLAFLDTRRGLYLLGVAAAGASSPLALVGLGFVMVYVVVRRRSESGRLRVAELLRSTEVLDLIALAAVGVVLASPLFIFHIRGTYPFYGSDLAMALAFAAVLMLAAIRLPRGDAVALRATAGLYAILVLLVFIHPGALGGNAARVGEISPVIIAAVWLRGDFRPVAARIGVAATLVLSLVWMSMSVVAPLGDPAAAYLTRAADWRPVIAALRPLADGKRVEYVDSLLHEGAWFLPRKGIAIARGWFRQDDFPVNAIFYGSALEPGAYRSWLCGNQIGAVVLPPGPYDYSSAQEAALVSSHPAFLSSPMRIGRFELFKVTGCPTPAAEVVRIARTWIEVRISGPGSYRIPLSYSPFAASSRGELAPASNGMTEITGSAPGLVRIDR